MTIQTINAEMMLLSWRESSSGGASITLAIDAEGLEVFKALTAAKSGKGGQRFMVAFALLGDDETPQPLPEPKAAPKPARKAPASTPNPKARVAVLLCKDPLFQNWLRALYDRHMGGDGEGWGDVHPDEFEAKTDEERMELYAKHCVMVITGCKESRSELDTNPLAWQRFTKLIGQPWEAAKAANEVTA